jgi:hypothetical protein
LEPFNYVKIQIEPQESPSRDKRFDISIKHYATRIIVVEVKCKTFGNLQQLEHYSSDAKAVLRCGFGEWNWPDLTEEQRARFPLVTLKDIGTLVRENLGEDIQWSGYTASEFADHIILESDFLEGLYNYFIECAIEHPPDPPTSFRYSQRFINQLYWHWFIQKVKEKRWPLLQDNYETRSETSGVWFVPFWAKIPPGKRKYLSKIKVELPGPLEFWLHAELLNKVGLLAKPEDPVGILKLCIMGDKEPGQRQSIFDSFKRQAEILQANGWEVRPSRANPSQGYYYIISRHLTASDFRFSRLIALMESVVGEDDVKA